MHGILQAFQLQVGKNQSRQVSNQRCKHSGFDLVIVDVPENLPVPGVNLPNQTIPPWNVRPKKFLDTVFEFADSYLHNHAALLLLHANDGDLHLEIEECAVTYDFKLCTDWWALNDIPLASPRNPSLKVQILPCKLFDFITQNWFILIFF